MKRDTYDRYLNLQERQEIATIGDYPKMDYLGPWPPKTFRAFNRYKSYIRIIEKQMIDHLNTQILNENYGEGSEGGNS